MVRARSRPVSAQGYLVVQLSQAERTVLPDTATDRDTTLTVTIFIVIAKVGDIITARIAIGFTGKQAARVTGPMTKFRPLDVRTERD
jgi:hypothetical protein